MTDPAMPVYDIKRVISVRIILFIFLNRWVDRFSSLQANGGCQNLFDIILDNFLGGNLVLDCPLEMSRDLI